MSRLQIHVQQGAGFVRTAERVAEAWHRAERGEPVEEHHLTFSSWDALAKVMTGERLELLRHLHRHPGREIAGIASSLKRTVAQVGEDVELLSAAGLIERDDVGVSASYDEIRTTIAL